MRPVRILFTILMLALLVISVRQVVKQAGDECEAAEPIFSIGREDPEENRDNAKTLTTINPRNYYKWVLSAGYKGQKSFLTDLSVALQSYGEPGTDNNQFFNNFTDLYEMLGLLIQGNNKCIANSALAIIKELESMHTATIIKPVSESEFINSALINVIKESGFDTVRGDAIVLHALLYPPSDETISMLENVVLSATDNDYSAVAAVFRAYERYERLYGLVISVSTLDAAASILDHPSEAVSVERGIALAKSGGVSVIPVLLNRLGKSGVSESNSVTIQILMLDKSDNTVNRLREIAQNSHPTKKYVIEDAIHNKDVYLQY